MSHLITKSLQYEHTTALLHGTSDGLEYFQEDYFQDDYFQSELLYYSANVDKYTTTQTKERTTVKLDV